MSICGSGFGFSLSRAGVDVDGWHHSDCSLAFLRLDGGADEDDDDLDGVANDIASKECVTDGVVLSAFLLDVLLLELDDFDVLGFDDELCFDDDDGAGSSMPNASPKLVPIE